MYSAGAPFSRNRNGPLIFSMWMRPRREKKRANAPKRNVSFAPDSVAKSFWPPKINFPGCGRGPRMIVRGTRTRDELTGNFGSALEDASISDYRLCCLRGKNAERNFRVLQHYPPINRHRQAVSACPKSANKRLMHRSKQPPPRPFDSPHISSVACRQAEPQPALTDRAL